MKITKELAKALIKRTMEYKKKYHRARKTKTEIFKKKKRAIWKRDAYYNMKKFGNLDRVIVRDSKTGLDKIQGTDSVVQKYQDRAVNLRKRYDKLSDYEQRYEKKRGIIRKGLRKRQERK